MIDDPDYKDKAGQPEDEAGAMEEAQEEAATEREEEGGYQ